MTVQKFRPEWDRSEDVAWQDKAACKANPSAEYAFMYGSARVRNQAIETYCGACPVRAACLNFAVESMSEGVWGGVYRTMADAQSANSRTSALRGHERHRVRGVVVKMYNSGLSMRRIARELHKGEETVKNLLEEAGVQLRVVHSGR